MKILVFFGLLPKSNFFRFRITFVRIAKIGNSFGKFDNHTTEIIYHCQ